MARLKRPSRLNGEGRSPSLHWPHSVAWISQWLAEPRTRVRIAVGPPITQSALPYALSLGIQVAGGRHYSSSLTRVTLWLSAALADALSRGKNANATHISIHTPHRYDISSVILVTSLGSILSET